MHAKEEPFSVSAQVPPFVQGDDKQKLCCVSHWAPVQRERKNNKTRILHTKKTKDVHQTQHNLIRLVPVYTIGHSHMYAGSVGAMVSVQYDGEQKLPTDESNATERVMEPPALRIDAMVDDEICTLSVTAEQSAPVEVKKAWK